MKNTGLTLLILLFCNISYSQLDVTEPPAANQSDQNDLVDYLLGSGVTRTSNATVVGVDPNTPFNSSGTYSYGYFDGTNSNIGLDSGMVLATGNIMEGIGPNDSQGTSFCGTDLGEGGDADLDAEFGIPGWPGTESYDATSITFEFIPSEDTIVFNYVFASEEYPEFVCSGFNDAFALFIEGVSAGALVDAPSYENIALIPGTGQRVEINSVNGGSIGSAGNPGDCISLTNTAYYVDNTGGTTVQYDGFTVPLTAARSVVAGETYRLKFVVADVNDHCKNSAVFVEAGSVRSPAPVDCNNLVADATINHTTCGLDNGQVTFNPGGTSAPYLVTWSGGETQSDSLNIASGSYDVTISDGGACTLDTTVVVNSSSAIMASISSVTDVACFGDFTGEATVTTNGTLPIVCGWDDPANQLGFTAVGLGAGDYVASITDDNGCTASVNVLIDGPASALYADASVSSTSCGLDNGQVTFNPTGGNGSYVVTWTGGENTIDSLNISSGSYTVNIADGGGCDFDTTVVVDASTVIGADISSFNYETCFGDEDGTATAGSDGQAPFTYQWDDPMNQTSQTATGLGTGIYNVTITDANGCVQSTFVDLSSGGPDEITTTISTSDADCGLSNGSASLVVSGGDGSYTYDWTDSGGSSDTESNLAAGTFNVTITDGNGCSLDTFAIVQNPNAPNLGIEGTTDVLCWGATSGEASVSASGGTSPYTFTWSHDAGETSTSVSNLAAGSYTVQVTDANNCSAVVAFDIAEPSNPMWLSSSSNDASCGSNNGDLMVSASGGTSPYSFDMGGNTNTTGFYDGLTAGSYAVTVTDANGCIEVSQVSVSNANGPELVSLTVNSPECTGDNDGDAFVTITGGSPDYSYFLDGVATNSFVENLSPGDYEMLVVDALACSLYVDINVASPDSVIANISYSITNQTVPTSIELDGSSSLNALNYQWTVNDQSVGFSSSESYNVNEAGDYLIELVVDNGSCTDTVYTAVVLTEEEAFKIPDIFTPNDDGFNDYFTLENTIYDYVHMEIYNRWGELVFMGEGSNIYWDGRLISGEEASEGTYYYVIRFGDNMDGDVQSEKGHLTLWR